MLRALAGQNTSALQQRAGKPVPHGGSAQPKAAPWRATIYAASAPGNYIFCVGGGSVHARLVQRAQRGGPSGSASGRPSGAPVGAPFRLSLVTGQQLPSFSPTIPTTHTHIHPWVWTGSTGPSEAVHWCAFTLGSVLKPREWVVVGVCMCVQAEEEKGTHTLCMHAIRMHAQQAVDMRSAHSSARGRPTEDGAPPGPAACTCTLPPRNVFLY